jgi:sulfur-oxidizing protein SoxY
MRTPCSIRSGSITRLAVLALGIALSLAPLPARAEDDPWPGLQADAFNSRPMIEGSGVVGLEAPYRAEDAAIVPMTITLRPAPAPVRKVTVVIDRNPAPVAAVFTLGETAGISRIATRFRVNSYTRVHVVAETSDGKLHVAEKFVKASGGCSAPAGKDPAEAKANMGKMKLRQFAMPDGRREMQLMLRHPQHSGFQMDQITHYYTPAMFVRDLIIRQGDALMLSVEGGISLSEDPNIRFDFAPNGADRFRIEAVDTDERHFRGEFPVETVSQ